MSQFIRYAVEGTTDAPAAEAIIRAADRFPLQTLIAGGSQKLDNRIRTYNQAAAREPWLVLRDCDRPSPQCDPHELMTRLLNGDPRSKHMSLRIVIPHSEAWYLADADSFSEYFHVSKTRIPQEPETLANAKQAVVNLCRRSSSRAIRDDVILRDGSGRVVGPAYTARIVEFATTRWNLPVAASGAPSLARATNRAVQMTIDGLW